MNSQVIFQLFGNNYTNVYIAERSHWLLLKALVIEVLRIIEVDMERCSSFFALYRP